jgi:hypothetical protein
MIFAAICRGWSRASRPSYSGRHQNGRNGDGDAPLCRDLPGMAADDHRATRRRRLAELAGSFGVAFDGELFDALLIEGAAITVPARARKP